METRINATEKDRQEIISNLVNKLKHNGSNVRVSDLMEDAESHNVSRNEAAVVINTAVVEGAVRILLGDGDQVPFVQVIE